MKKSRIGVKRCYEMSGFQMMTKERRIIQEFIDIYKNEPSLWKVRCVFYTNKEFKAAAYRRMVNKLQEIDPDADVDMVKKKINALRTNYRKELRKVMASKERNRITGEPVYIPSLWYFDQLSFIAEQDAEEHPNQVYDANGTGEVDYSDDFEEGENIEEFEEQLHLSVESSTDEGQEILPTISESYDVKRVVPKRARHSATPSSNGLLTDSSHQQQSSSCNDGQDEFGRYVASKLKQMDKENRLLSERLIAEVLFRGHMKILTKGTYLSTEDLPVSVKVEETEE